MKTWGELIDELLSQYYLIFGKDNRDMRLSCTMDTDVIRCYGLDEIEICVYCIMQEAGLINDLKWKIEQAGDKYYFIPTAGDQFNEALQEMSTQGYKKCEESKAIYLPYKKLIPLYKTCRGGVRTEKRIKSCKIVVDMIFHLNRSERKKEDLDNFCAMFCCCDVAILQILLLDVIQHINENKTENKRELLKQVTLFMEKVFSFRNCITKKDGANGEYLNSLKSTSTLVVNLLRQREKGENLSICQYWDMSYEYKIKMEFPTAVRKWNYKAGIGPQGSTQEVFRKLVTMCMGKKVAFSDSEDDVETVKAILGI